MNTQSYRSAMIVAFLLLCPVFVFAQKDSGIIFLVRHGEKVSNAPDAVLSPAGLERAQCLARTLRDSGIASIYVTDVKRTQQTAQPLANALHVKPTVVPNPGAKQNASTVVEQLSHREKHNALVVGHQDTLPLIIEELGGGKIPMDQVQYDSMIVLVPRGPHSASVAMLHYCQNDSAASANMQASPR